MGIMFRRGISIILNPVLIVILVVNIFTSAIPGYAFTQALPDSSSVIQSLHPDLKSSVKSSLLANPFIDIKGPGDILIGENFTFTISFSNKGSSQGYGPFIDLVLPTNGADGNHNLANQDGVEFVEASTAGYIFSAIDETLALQKFPNATGSSGFTTCVDHTWARLSNGEPAKVCGRAGDTLVSLRLPFSAFVPGQPAADITVEAKLSPFADLNTTLNIQSRGGFLYGNDSLDNGCCGDPIIIDHPSTDSTTWPISPLTPKLITFEKSYSGPDNLQAETSSGPNLVRQYTLVANIADGQTITDLDMFDKLPNNEQFVSLDTAFTTPGYSSTSVPATTVPGGTLDLRYGSVTGSLSPEDVKVVFTFYIPRLNPGGASVINPVSGEVVQSQNIAWMAGHWTPTDPRDAAQSITSDAQCVPDGNCQPLHTLQDKSIAIQKTVTDLTDDNPSPGDVFEYSLTFQVSDYFAFDNVSVADLISDGQHVISNFTPTMQISGNGYTLATAAMGAANYDISCNYAGGPGAECTSNNPAADDGTTKLTFRVSPEIITRGQNGRMIGGCVNPSGGLLATCSPSSLGDGPTTGVITFRTVLQDNFTNNYLSGDKSVDQGDKLTDTAQINGRVLDNTSFTGSQWVDDDAAADFSIRRNDFHKEIYAINSDPNPANWPIINGEVLISPGDTVTYRLIYNLNTSDVEDLAFEDFLALPVFFAADPDANDYSAHNNGPAFVIDDTKSSAAPAVAHAHFGPTDTFRAYSGIVPTVSQNSTQNTILFNYGDYDNPANQPTIVDLLFTLTASSEPFADHYFISNAARQSEGSTNTDPFTQNAVERAMLSQPALAVTLGVIWTNRASAVLDPQPAGPVSFSGPGAAPRWTGTIHSNNLAANPIISDIAGVSAGDTVSFAIVIENKGSSRAGAYDLVIRDMLPKEYEIPASGLNLQTFYGDGTGPIKVVTDGVVTSADCTSSACGPDHLANTPDDIFGRGIKLVDPLGSGVIKPYNATLGNNVIVITYDLKVKNNPQPGTFTNTARLDNYASGPNGPDFVQGNKIWNLDVQDTAETALLRPPALHASAVPETGFAPQHITVLPVQPLQASYTSMPKLWLEIPALKVKAPIVGVPGTSTGWNLTWLANQVGYLQGTTLPTDVGNTVLTAHNYLADGTPGPFVNLDQLSWGQAIILHADGYRYLFEVRQNRMILPNDLAVFKKDGYARLTLLTCKGYNEAKQTYQYRVAITANLIKVEPE